MMRAWLSREIERWIVRMLPFIIGRSLRRGLHAVWARVDSATLPPGGAVLAVNHHSWWDLYLCWLVGQRLGRRVSGVMAEAQLGRFRFFRQLGALGTREPLEAIRRLRRGDLLFIFPEGELRVAGPTGSLQRGALFLANKAAVPLYPLAFRVAMRGAQYPEAFVVLGEGLVADETTLEALQTRLDALLNALDTEIRTAPPEAAPPGFDPWLHGRASISERTAWVGRLWS